MVGTQSARLGSPTEKKGISAFRPACASRSNVAGIRDKSNSLERNAATFGNRGHILVAPTGKVNQQNLFLSHGRRHFHGLCQRMAGFKCWNDAFHATKRMKGMQRLVVIDGHIFGPMGVLEPGMLGSNAGIIETRRNGVGFDDLSIAVL